MRRAVPVTLAVAALAAAAGVYVFRHAGARGVATLKSSPATVGETGTSDHGAPAASEVEIPHPVAANNEVGLTERREPIDEGGDPVAATLEKVLAEDSHAEGGNPRAIPEGTRLLHLDVKDGRATLNLTHEFDALNEHGSTAEELAQNTLREALAQFPAVKKMRVLVEGKLFEGGHGGVWDDIPVRDEQSSESTGPGARTGGDS